MLQALAFFVKTSVTHGTMCERRHLPPGRGKSSFARRAPRPGSLLPRGYGSPALPVPNPSHRPGGKAGVCLGRHRLCEAEEALRGLAGALLELSGGREEQSSPIVLLKNLPSPQCPLTPNNR